MLLTVLVPRSRGICLRKLGKPVISLFCVWGEKVKFNHWALPVYVQSASPATVLSARDLVEPTEWKRGVSMRHGDLTEKPKHKDAEGMSRLG